MNNLNLTVFYKLLQATKDEILEDLLNRLENTEQDIYLLHLEMLVDEGYIKGASVSSSGSALLYGITYPRLTQRGYQLCDGLKDLSVVKTITEKAKKLDKTLTLSFAEAVISTLTVELLKCE